MSRTSPGRYALHEFAKNVYDVRAFDGAGHAIDVTAEAIRRGGERVRVTITLAADSRLELVPIERTGGALTEAQQAFRHAWLGVKVRAGTKAGSYGTHFKNA